MSAPRRPLLHWLLLFALVVMWGSSFAFTKVAVTALAPEAVVAARLAIAAVVLIVVGVALGRRVPVGRRLWAYSAAMAVVGNALPFVLISWGQQGISSGLAGILMAVMPLTTMVLAHVFVEGEQLTPVKVAGFVVGFLGVVVLIGPEALLALGGSRSALVSQLAVLGGAVCYAVNTILARRRPPADAIATAAGVTVIAAVLMVPVAAAGDARMTLDVPVPALVAVAVLGVMSTAVATVVYFRLVAAAGPSFLSQINYLIPVWAVGVGVTVMGEEPEWSALGGLVLVLAGIALSERGRASPSAVAEVTESRR